MFDRSGLERRCHLAARTGGREALGRTSRSFTRKKNRDFGRGAGGYLPPTSHGRSAELGEKRATLIVGLEELRKRAAGVSERTTEIRTYKETLSGEIDRLNRVTDAGELLSDLRVTHCPACDQAVSDRGKELP